MANLQNLRPFPKGVSGNPGGRPSDRIALRHALTQTRNGNELVDHYLDLMRNARKEATRLAALDSLREWLFGKAPSDRAALLGALGNVTEVHFRATFGSAPAGVEANGNGVEVAAAVEVEATREAQRTVADDAPIDAAEAPATASAPGIPALLSANFSTGENSVGDDDPYGDAGDD